MFSMLSLIILGGNITELITFKDLSNACVNSNTNRVMWDNWAMILLCGYGDYGDLACKSFCLFQLKFGPFLCVCSCDYS